MNSPKNSFIFAAVLGVILSANPTASFSSSTRIDSSGKAKVLTDGSEVQFSSYVQEKLPKYSKKADWATVEQIVAFYSQSTGKLHTISAADKKAFNEAVEVLGKKLRRQKEDQAIQWANDLNKTAQQIRFIWSFDLDSLTPTVIESPLPVAPIPVKSVM